MIYGGYEVRYVLRHVYLLEPRAGILLYLDEIQYLNKKQQQSLLEYIEDGSITLIASTTENPYFYVFLHPKVRRKSYSVSCRIL